MERPAHTALFQSIWNHPAEENGQNVNLGSWGGSSFCGLPSPLPLLVAAIIRAPVNYRVVHLVIFVCLIGTALLFFGLCTLKKKKLLKVGISNYSF